MFSRPNICIHSLHISIYSDNHSCTQTKLYIYIYIYIYAEQDPIHHLKATGAARSCSQHV